MSSFNNLRNDIGSESNYNVGVKFGKVQTIALSGHQTMLGPVNNTYILGAICCAFTNKITEGQNYKFTKLWWILYWPLGVNYGWKLRNKKSTFKDQGPLSLFQYPPFPWAICIDSAASLMQPVFKFCHWQSILCT